MKNLIKDIKVGLSDLGKYYLLKARTARLELGLEGSKYYSYKEESLCY